MNGPIINIRLNSSFVFPVTTDVNWDINRLKEEISIKNQIPKEEIRIIFQGRELKDGTFMKEYDFGNHTILHAVRGKKRLPGRTEISAAPQLPQGLNAIAEITNTRRTLSNASHDGDTAYSCGLKSQFYVYCKRVCSRVQPGKIRVRCSLCKLGTITVGKDPCNWNDVLIANSIKGDCQEPDCNGDTAEFYFKCKAHESEESDDTAIPLHMIVANIKNIPCITCMEIINPVLVFECRDKHAICLDCFRMYCTTKLNDRDFVHSQENGYTLSCPAGCDNSNISEIHHFRVLGDEQYDRYQHFGAEECVLHAGGVLCPHQGCGAGILPEDDTIRIECEECNFVFCRTCKESFHRGDCGAVAENISAESGNAAYQVDPQNMLIAQWENASKETIQQTTKPCPKCKVPTEKDGGCMHMACSRCSYQWCWQCHTEWNRDCQGDHWFG